MMELASAFPGLEDLVEPGHSDAVDMRPTLLRVLTDLYLQRPVHTPEDERYYTELALRLIEAVDVDCRIALAERLANYPSAPVEILRVLARDRIEVASAILKHSLGLDQSELDCIAQQLGGMYAAAIASRVPGKIAQQQAEGILNCRMAEARELSELFYAAGETERQWMLIGLEYAEIPAAQPSLTMQRTDIWQLESAALQHNVEFVVRELQRTLGVSRIQAQRIVGDPCGEPLVIAAKALQLPADVLQRMLLFMNPRIGQSVDRVYELGELFSRLSPAAARRMLGIWRMASEADEAPAAHEKIAWRTAAENARRALSEVSRRPGPGHYLRTRGGVG